MGLSHVTRVGWVWKRKINLGDQMKSDEELREIVILSIARIRESLPDIATQMGRVTSITIKSNRRGHANWNTGAIVLPRWLQNRDLEYIEYYIAHELAHIVAPIHSKHNHVFHAIEMLFCKVLNVELDFGPPQPGRKPAYPKKVRRI